MILRNYIENIDREWWGEGDPGRLKHAIEMRRTDPVHALKELEDLANGGSALAMLYIGDTYGNGRGVSRNVKLGDQWYQRAADRGSIEAAHRLAFGHYHNRDYDKAISILEGLCERGFTPAMFWLGTICYTGRGVNKNNEKAIEYWTIAEAGGHLLEKRRLSILLRSGQLGLIGRLKGYAKLLTLIIPFVICSVKYPRSDRLRDW